MIAHDLRLSVIVPVHNGGDGLRRCLQGLAGSLRPPDEVIVVDDGSTDDSAADAAALGARVVITVAGPRGPAFARNRGAEAATGDVLVFVDADVVVHADTLAGMESVLADEPEVAALFGCYDDHPQARDSASLYKNLLHHYVHQHGQREAGSFWAGCGAVRRAVFLAAGGFDESYARPSIEDIELGVRLRRAGQRIRLCPEIQATHLKRWTLASLWRTDLFSRAIPWTRLILREGRLPSDLNLSWTARLAAVAAWTFLLCGLLVAGFGLLGHLAAWPALGMLISAAGVVALNADLFRFFFRRGGARFALVAAALHVGYLLYSSLVFASLLIGHHLRGGGGRRCESAIK
jgi:GT2 family glycosyltransferase